jgi:hypothetical protein
MVEIYAASSRWERVPEMRDAREQLKAVMGLRGNNA